MAYCLFTADIPFTNLISFILWYLTMHITGDFPGTQIWESDYFSECTFSPSSVNWLDHPTSELEDDEKDGEKEDTHII